jgi:putative phosphoesterase
VITVVADTHGREDHRLEGRTLEAVREADLVIHAGDFRTEAVLDAFERETDSLAAVAGNNDPPAVRERVPDERVVEHRGARIAVAHGHEHTETALSLFGRQSMADLVVVGHSHRPGFRRAGTVPVLNPGSHADPRQFRPAHAELEVGHDGEDSPSGEGRSSGGKLAGRLVDPDGTVFETFTVDASRPEPEGG